MSTLSLVAPNYRETAGVITVFDYDTQPLAEIRAVLLQAYGTKYGSPDLVEKEETFFAGAEGDPQVRGLLYRPKAIEGLVPAILHIHGGGWIGGTADMMASFCADLAARHGVMVLSVDYRLVPETVFPHSRWCPGRAARIPRRVSRFRPDPRPDHGSLLLRPERGMNFLKGR